MCNLHSPKLNSTMLTSVFTVFVSHTGYTCRQGIWALCNGQQWVVLLIAVTAGNKFVTTTTFQVGILITDECIIQSCAQSRCTTWQESNKVRFLGPIPKRTNEVVNFMCTSLATIKFFVSTPVSQASLSRFDTTFAFYTVAEVCASQRNLT